MSDEIEKEMTEDLEILDQLIVRSVHLLSTASGIKAEKAKIRFVKKWAKKLTKGN